MQRRFARYAAVLLAAPLILLAVQSAPQSVSVASKAPSASTVAKARANFIKDMSAHATALGGGNWTSPTVEHAGKATAANGTVSEFPSYNWSGYADSESGTKTVTYVSGDWTMPGVTCPTAPYQNSDAFLANWVGIDGFSDSTVEQLGTAAQCYEGVTYYYVWYEMFPNATVQEGTQACINDNVDCPRPGDQISASVTTTPGAGGVNNYTLALTDYSTFGNNFSVQATCATSTCLDQSAEWIMERPAFELPFGAQILPMVDFSQDGYTNGTVTSDGQTTSIAGFQGGPVYDIPMVDDSLSYYLACVNQFGPPGQLLLVTQTNACPASAPQRWNGSFNVTWDGSF